MKKSTKKKLIIALIVIVILVALFLVARAALLDFVNESTMRDGCWGQTPL